MLLGCSGQTSPKSSSGRDTPATTDARQSQPREPFTRCDDDSDCLLSCIAADDCCAGPGSDRCDQARHYDDHAKIEATRSDCLDFDYTTCPAADHGVSEWVHVPVCKRGRCQAKKIERQAPPAPIDLSGYDRSCKSDADCVLVHSQPCAKCGCASEPIAASEQLRFAQEIASFRCPPYDPWPDVQCGSCMESTAYCDAGRCQARQ